MDLVSQNLLMTSGGKKDPVYLDDVFSTYLYYGNCPDNNLNTTQTITNGIDLAGEGGLVWLKHRTGLLGSAPHALVDTERGANKTIYSNSSQAQDAYDDVNAFYSNGFQLKGQGNAGCSNYGQGSTTTAKYSSWTFRKQKGFFDIVTYTGNGSNRDLSHSLGSIPGCIMVKRTDAVNEWAVYHKSTGTGKFLMLDQTSAALSNANFWYNGPTATTFGIGPHDYVNINGGTYVAYIFAGGESSAATARSVDFDGNDSLTLAASNDFHCTGDLTIEGWFNPDTLDDFLFCLGDKGGAYGVTVYLDGSQLKMKHSGALKMTVSGTPVPIGQWTHVTLERSGSTVRLYVNGISRATYQDYNDFGGANDSQKTFTVGSGLSSGSATEQFDGKISNFRVVKGTAVYTSSFRVPTEPLTAITNTVLLCCNNSSTTGSTVTPGTITANGDPTASTDSPFDDTAGFKFGEGGDQNIIKCGSYVGNGSDTGPEINLGWEASWVMLKRTDSTDNWPMYDAMRGITTGGTDNQLRADQNAVEHTTGTTIAVTPTGFKLETLGSEVNANNGEYIYIAIRRSDGYVAKPAEAGTDVFAIDTGGGSSTIPDFDSGFPVDMGLLTNVSTTDNNFIWSRLTGKDELRANATNTASTANCATWDSNVGFGKCAFSSNSVAWMWKRHAGFDVVTYQGLGVTGQQVPHNLSKVPEMMWVKRRDGAARDWQIYHKGLNGGTNPEQYKLLLNSNTAEALTTTAWASTAPTSSHITLGHSSDVNSTSTNYLAILFASVDGISKCGYYDGSASTQTITTGFQPRFVILRNVGGGYWFVLDTTRGWGAGNESYLLLDTNNPQYTDHDFGAPTSTGFTLTSFATYNGAGEKYIYYAHA